MDHILIRYGEIGSKSDIVRSKMAKILRQRIVDRLEYEGLEFDKVSLKQGRIIVNMSEPEKAAELLSGIPGVASSSPATKTEAEVGEIKKVVKKQDIGETFGVRTNRAGEHRFTSQEINKDIGSFVEQEFGASVDLDGPDTWVRIDVRYENAYVFTEKFEGPDGFPVGAENSLAVLISGGIDSPVAAYQVMNRGSDIIPIYFYNRPLSAEDHLLRFRSVLEKLKRFHPGKKWEYYVVDMKEVNQSLMDIERGRMVLHRKIMFRVAEKIAEKEGLEGIVTGESLGQKSSQTPSNLKETSSSIDMPVHRPLLTLNKNQITDMARDLGTLEDADVASACKSLAPASPATEIKEEDVDRLEEKVNIDELVEIAFSNAEKESDLKV